MYTPFKIQSQLRSLWAQSHSLVHFLISGSSLINCLLHYVKHHQRTSLSPHTAFKQQIPFFKIQTLWDKVILLFVVVCFCFFSFRPLLLLANNTTMGRLSTIQRRTHCPSSTCFRGWNSKVQVEVWCVLWCILWIMESCTLRHPLETEAWVLLARAYSENDQDQM